MTNYPLPAYLQRFFIERLTSQLRASPHTIASYRDTFRLLLRFANERINRSPVDLLVDHLDCDLVGKFLDSVETDRGNVARTRNARLAAIRSFFRYVASNEPQLLHHCQRVLAIPSKRHVKRTIDFLERQEIEALIAAPNLSTWIGRRDRALLLVAVQTGLRVSELIYVTIGDVELGVGAHVRCIGKGRKERSTPLRKDCVKVLHEWIRERKSPANAPLFVTFQGKPLSRDAIERLVHKHAKIAARSCSSLGTKHVTPHVLRHSAAMELLQSGVDRIVIALWLGHESVETTQMYVHANMKMKEIAMARTTLIEAKPTRYRPDDSLLEFLESL